MYYLDLDYVSPGEKSNFTYISWCTKSNYQLDMFTFWDLLICKDIIRYKPMKQEDDLTTWVLFHYYLLSICFSICNITLFILFSTNQKQQKSLTNIFIKKIINELILLFYPLTFVFIYLLTNLIKISVKIKRCD